MAVKFLSTGSALPENVLTNNDMEKFIDTSDEWIFSRSGIKERHVSTTDTTTSLMHKAALMAVNHAGIDANELDLIICSTVTPDSCVPSTASQISRLLEIKSCTAFDLNAACTGFIYAGTVAKSLMEMMNYKYALVIAGDVLSRIVDWTERSTCVLFGDGAGAVVLKREDGPSDILTADIKGFSDFENVLYCHNPKIDTPFYEGAEIEDTKMRMNGRKVFVFAINAMNDSINAVLEKAGVSSDEVKWIVPHQANERIIASTSQRMNIPIERFYMNLSHTGNTSSASVPIALDEMNRSGKLNRGDLVLFVGFGGGLTSGGMLIRW